MRARVLAAITAAMVPCVAGAQLDYRPDHPGTWSWTSRAARAEPALTSEERRALLAQLRAVGTVVAAAPALTPLRGVTVEAAERLDLGCEHDEHPCRLPVVGAWTEVAMMGLYQEAGRVVPKRNEPPGLLIALNDPMVALSDHALDYERLFDERGREIFTGLTEIGRVGSAVIWDNNVVVVAKPGRSLTSPVSRESYLRALLKRHASERILVDLFTAELAALSPSDRKAPAFVGTSEKPSRLVDSATDGAAALVTIDPGYFDPALPRTAVQLIAIKFGYGNRYRDEAPTAPDYAPDAIKVWQTRQTIDYEKLRRLLR